MYDVAVIGLGRVGLPLALAFADAGLRVMGIDKDPERLDAVRARRMPFKEPGTDELLERELADVAVHDPMVATPSASFEQAVDDADVVIVATNHSVFERPEALAAIADRAKPDCLVVDPWNALGAAQVFAYANEIAALRA